MDSDSSTKSRKFSHAIESTLPLGTKHPSNTELSVGLVINKFSSTHYGRILDGACEFLINCGYMPLIQPSYLTPFREYRALENLLERNCAGVIFHSDALSNGKLEQLMHIHPNLVVVNRFIERFEDRCVYIDNTVGAQQAAQHLIDNGHTNVAMITGPRSKLGEVEIRTNEFVKAFEAQGIEIPTELIVEGDFTYEGGLRSFHKLLSSRQSFTAVFAQNDSMAMGIFTVCKEKGLRVPEDISIVGYDNHYHFGRHMHSSLTTIHQPIEEVGRRAAQLMNGLISRESTAQFPSNYGRLIPELVERDTVALLKSPQRFNNSELINNLSSREIECLTWIAAGKTSGEIAIILSISESTVNYHLKNILLKLNASNRAQAVAIAVSAGAITL